MALAAKIVEEMEDNEDDVFFASGTDLVDVDASSPGTALAFMAWALEELVSTLYNFFFFGAEKIGCSNPIKLFMVVIYKIS
jgi:hypothetical protein